MISEESGPSLVSFGPVPDLTGSVIKLDDQYSEGGSFGDVYRCKYLSNSGTKEVAVKAFRFEFTVNEHDGNGSDRSSRMIRRELGIWRRLDHENIVPFLGIVYGFGRLRTASLVSLWMPHGTLHNLIAKHHDKLTNSRRLQLLLDVANGLLYLHSFPIIHGDLSSNNVLIDANYNARLTDFGYASLLGEIPEALAYLQMSTRRPGTLRWAAPEQLFPGPEDTLERRTKSDIYSFGSIALEASHLATNPSSALSLLQVFSGELPWSEVRGDAAVIVLVSEGQKPSRPQSYPINDQHWEFIERCWSEVLERPAAKDIVSALGHFRASLLVDLLRLSAKFTDSQPASSGSPSPSASRAQLLEVYQEAV
ncbi:hypothetical protein PAXINDRAFT_101209 [Paxillus involutus ATCC 200175]|uniref:Protein kinase domain-containing protein n=1 Tax=Paxillus involutus ATCC 200175 TaxID=664439 RepID=A0A0C9T9T2_PAXIN|nr:hypothetical protein PAXINDRAFT_101209 [Paxillus involutus ATCC 200175]